MPDRKGSVSGRLLLRPGHSPAWQSALLAGFIVQLLLILFVTGIGLEQLRVTTDALKSVVNVHMRKQYLAKTLLTSSRERAVNLFRMVESKDPFELDEMRMRFNGNASDFLGARGELMGMPLSDRERELLELQRRHSRVSVPLQFKVLELLDAGQPRKAEALLLREVLPVQDKALEALTLLERETQRAAAAATREADEEYRVARFWMGMLSIAALLAGLIVTAATLRYVNRASREREHLATHDALTGLPNRMLFMDRLEQALVRAQRHGSMVGVMFIDLDRFKRVNDTLGHDVGDRLLCEVAERLRHAMRAEDVVARLGGDEFVVVVTDLENVGQIVHLVERVQDIVADPHPISGHELFVSCSIGISFYPGDGTDASTLIRKADTAMYHAKGSGGRFQLYDEAMNAMAEERLRLETELYHAIEREELVLHYQPQLDLESGRICAVEALMRWNHPDRGVLGPALFLDLLEETGEIVEIGRKLLVEACRQAAKWHAAGFGDLQIAVNVSGKEFWHQTMIPGVRDALEKSGIPPTLLQIELTEGILMQDVDNALSRIKALKEIGVTVAIDDFGTGHSSLAHLKRFPVDCLKIDRFFIKDIQDTAVNEAFVGSILTLCQGLHLDAVAEGVEDVRQIERLRRLGCKRVQGYLVSRAVPADRIADLLGRDWQDAFGRAGQATA